MPSSYRPESDPLCKFTKDELHLMLAYADGHIYRRLIDGSIDFSKPAGAKALSGYIVVSIKNKRYLAHRVIWRMHGKQMPETIDHINLDKTDNRIKNLRAATKAENLRNVGVKSLNKSGVKGVSWHKYARKWRGTVSVDGRQHHAGLFESKAECIAAVQLLRQSLHGDFARNA